MQRQEDGGVVIGCDFCGADWDQVRPMIEGHRGSVLCLECLKIALVLATEAGDDFACTLCLSDLPAGTKAWCHPDRPEAANPDAVLCESCMKQASGGFSKDPDVDWTRSGSGGQ